MAGAHSAPALAQAVEDRDQVGADVTDEGAIIVTARRRDETAQDTPVAITVLNGTLLDRYGVKGINTIAQLTPGMFTGEASGSVGGSISLRGIGSGDSQPFIDQAVSLNVDGVPISSAQLLRAAQLDLKQIEVLRGPQALFFGKNSPGGIISLISEDPGDKLEIMARGGYEFEASEKYAEATVSAPLGDTVGVRIAGRYSKQAGYIDVDSPVTPGYIPATIKHFPKEEETFLRGTIAFKPVEGFTWRLKGTYTHTDIEGGPSYYSDVTACPYGVGQGLVDSATNCANDGRILTSQLPPAFLALDPYLGTNGNGYRDNKQALVTNTFDFDLTDALTFTSVTGYYRIRERLASNGGYAVSSVNGFSVVFDQDQITQELRLRSSFDSPINFLVGGFYEYRKLYTRTFIGNPLAQAQGAARAVYEFPLESTHQKHDSFSGFGQLSWKPSEPIEITVGGRYTHEIKNLLDFTVRPLTGISVDATKLPAYPGGPKPRLTFNNFSPELTASYRPAPDIMLFASYKRGFKSGGFDAGFTAGAILANPARRQTFEPEKVKGFEGGIKSEWLNKQLTLNLTGYWYDYNNLQVSAFDTTARAFVTQNAAKARIRGLELETRFRPDAVPGLSLHASAALNDAKFREYLGACYNGQNVALGCDQVFLPAAVQNPVPAGGVLVNGVYGYYTSQDLSGRRLRKAPKWSLNAGGYYETAVSRGLMMSLSADVNYSSGYDTGTAYQPLAYQDSFAKLDATLRLFTEDKRWELALIGRNLTNIRNLVAGIDRTGTGSSTTKGSTLPLCASISSTGCNKLSDILGTPMQPRSVAVQATFRY
jgi:outer membrane receptor protein involved in Fe transport